MKIKKIDPGSKELLSALFSLDEEIQKQDWVTIYREVTPLDVVLFHTPIDRNLKLHLKK